MCVSVELFLSSLGKSVSLSIPSSVELEILESSDPSNSQEQARGKCHCY